ncbi:hypothetical protein HK104_002693, partial [Borealophlyctis nickersoniae]
MSGASLHVRSLPPTTLLALATLTASKLTSAVSASSTTDASIRRIVLVQNLMNVLREGWWDIHGGFGDEDEEDGEEYGEGMGAESEGMGEEDEASEQNNGSDAVEGAGGNSGNGTTAAANGWVGWTGWEEDFHDIESESTAWDANHQSEYGADEDDD